MKLVRESIDDALKPKAKQEIDSNIDQSFKDL